MRRPDLLTTNGEPSSRSVGRLHHDIPHACGANLCASSRSPRAARRRSCLTAIEVGRQGGYLPYGDGSATHRYDLTPFLAAPGAHTLEIRIDQTGASPIAAVDGVIDFDDGTPDLWLMTDPGWTVSSDGIELPLAIEPGCPATPPCST